MFRKVMNQLEAANFKARAAKGELACPACGAKPGRIPAQADEVIPCDACGIKASASEWAAQASGGIFTGHPERPPAGTKITRSADAAGTTVWQIPASGKFGFFLFFGIFWCAITALVSGGFLFAFLSGEPPEGDFPEWAIIPFFGIFWAVGLGLLYIAFRNKYATHVITADACSVTLVRELFGRARKTSLPASSIESVGQAVFYQQNYEPVYGVEIRGGRGKLRFGSVLTAGEKAWLVADIRRVVLGTGIAEPAPVARQSYFSVSLPQSRRHFFSLAVILALTGTTGFLVMIHVDFGVGGSSPEFLSGFRILHQRLGTGFQVIGLLMTVPIMVAGWAWLAWLIRTRNRETRIEGSESEVSIRTYQHGLILKDRPFPRDSITDIRSSVSGSSNGQPMKRIELIVGNRAEKVASWVDGEKADALVAEIRGALGIAS